MRAVLLRRKTSVATHYVIAGSVTFLAIIRPIPAAENFLEVVTARNAANVPS